MIPGPAEQDGMGWFYPIIYGGQAARRSGLVHHHICSTGPAHRKTKVIWPCHHARCRKETFQLCQGCQDTYAAKDNMDALMDAFVGDRPARTMADTPVGTAWAKKGIIRKNVGVGSVPKKP